MRTAKELPPVLTKAIADVVIRVNQAGFAHGDLHMRNCDHPRRGDLVATTCVHGSCSSTWTPCGW